MHKAIIVVNPFNKSSDGKEEFSLAKKFRVGIIASGRIARAHGQGWTECNRTEIVAIADSHPEALADYARDFNVKSQYLDYREMMEKEDLDIVSVCLMESTTR